MPHKSTTTYCGNSQTRRARGEVIVPAFALERLRRHRKEQATRHLLLGDEGHDLDLVCESGNGSTLDPDRFTKMFTRLAAQVGLDPATRLHDLRHAAATQLARNGVHPHVVSAMLGHSSVAFTLDVYTEEWDEGAAGAAAALEKAFAETRK